MLRIICSILLPLGLELLIQGQVNEPLVSEVHHSNDHHLRVRRKKTYVYSTVVTPVRSLSLAKLEVVIQRLLTASSLTNWLLEVEREEGLLGSPKVSVSKLVILSIRPDISYPEHWFPTGFDTFINMDILLIKDQGCR